jgi:hypothetical protein
MRCSPHSPINFAIADAMLAALADPNYGGFFDGRFNNVFLQSFDPSIVRYLSEKSDLPVVFLLTSPSCLDTADAEYAIAKFAAGIGTFTGFTTQECSDRGCGRAAGARLHGVAGQSRAA